MHLGILGPVKQAECARAKLARARTRFYELNSADTAVPFAQSGYTVIGTNSAGQAGHSTNTDTGALYTLNPNGAVYSSFVGDATCMFVGFSSNYSTVDALVVTKSNFQSMLTGVSPEHLLQCTPATQSIALLFRRCYCGCLASCLPYPEARLASHLFRVISPSLYLSLTSTSFCTHASEEAASYSIRCPDLQPFNVSSWTSQGQLDYSKAQPLPAGTWRNQRSASAVLATNTTETYVLVIVNTGGQAQNGTRNSATQVGFRIAAYDKSSTGVSLSLFCLQK